MHPKEPLLEADICKGAINEKTEAEESENCLPEEGQKKENSEQKQKIK